MIDYEEFLKEKYNKTTLTAEELSQELSGISVRMIKERARKCSSEIPPFIKIGGKLAFPIKEVAKFLEKALIKVA